MNTLCKFTIVSVLAASLITACSDSQEAASPQAHNHEQASAHDPAGTSHTEDHRTKQEPEVHTPNDNASAARSADAHTHGDAELAIVLEKSLVTIELDSPLYNILGFEHAPETDTQKTAVKQAQRKLAQSGTLFTFSPKAQCTDISKTLNVVLFEPESHDEDTHVEHADHKDTHEHQETDEDQEDNHDTDTHKDILLTYEFQCQSPAKLSNVRINLFEFFEELSEVDVTFLGPASQKQVTLTRNKNQMDIPQ